MTGIDTLKHHPERCHNHPNAPYKTIRRGNSEDSMTGVSLYQFVCAGGDHTRLGWWYQDVNEKIVLSGPGSCEDDAIWNNTINAERAWYTFTYAAVLGAGTVAFGLIAGIGYFSGAVGIPIATGFGTLSAVLLTSGIWLTQRRIRSTSPKMSVTPRPGMEEHAT